MQASSENLDPRITQSKQTKQAQHPHIGIQGGILPSLLSGRRQSTRSSRQKANLPRPVSTDTCNLRAVGHRKPRPAERLRPPAKWAFNRSGRAISRGGDAQIPAATTRGLNPEILLGREANFVTGFLMPLVYSEPIPVHREEVGVWHPTFYLSSTTPSIRCRGLLDPKSEIAVALMGFTTDV